MLKIKALLLTIVVIFSCFSYVSCEKNREYDEAEVVLAAKDLIKKSEVLNEIYYGKGISYNDDKSAANGNYYPADTFHLTTFGIETVDDIKKLTYQCFSSGMSNSIISTKLTSISDDDGIKGFARYYQKYSAIDNTPECIMVYKDATVYLTDRIEYHYDNITASHSKGEEVFVNVTVPVITADGKTQEQTLSVSLIEESDGWRINSPTYCKYVDRDYYEDLQK